MNKIVNENNELLPEVKDLIKYFLEVAVDNIYKDFGIVPQSKEDKQFISQSIVNNILYDESFNDTYNNKIYPYIKEKYNLPRTIYYKTN